MKDGARKRAVRTFVMTNRRAGCGLIAIVLLSVTAIAGSAWAYSSAVEKQVVVSPGGVRTATASCPVGQHVTLGGIGAPLVLPLGTPGPLVFPQSMFMDSTQTKWSVVGVNGAFPRRGVLAARVYCGPHPARHVERDTVQVGARSANSAFARCPEGQVVLAGGYRTPAVTPFPDVLVTMMRAKNARTLEVRGFNLGEASRTLRAIAYCGPGPAPSEHVAEVSIDGEATSPTPVTATCPDGRKLIFGGFHAQFPGSGAQPQAVPFGLLARDSKQWTVRGYNPAPTAGFLRALAYCRA
jgi:hypothetical protein